MVLSGLRNERAQLLSLLHDLNESGSHNKKRSGMMISEAKRGVESGRPSGREPQATAAVKGA